MYTIHIHSEEEYINLFHNKIDSTDTQTIGFSNHSIGFYRAFYKYSEKPVKALVVNGEVVCVLFYSITKLDKYVSILNIVTPVKHRQKGYAKILMASAVKEAYNAGKRRLRMNCDFIEGTIRFYNRLGCIYWGCTNDGALYCNVPLLSDNIDDFHKLNDMKIEDLLDESSIKLCNRRLNSGLSSVLYENTRNWVDLSKYKYNEFKEKYGSK